MMEIHLLAPEEVETAMGLVRKVFLEFEAPDYESRGVETFLEFIDPEAVRARTAAGSLVLWGCFDGVILAGVLGLRDVSHICLLFVRKDRQRRGVARALTDTAADRARDAGAVRLTVNSSPYAVEIYRRLGFAPTDGERCANGIRFTPMARPLLPQPERGRETGGP